MTRNKYINSGLEWALTPQASMLLDYLLKLGMDYDLAYAVLEVKLSEEEIYDLDGCQNEQN